MQVRELSPAEDVRRTVKERIESARSHEPEPRPRSRDEERFFAPRRAGWP